MDVVTAKAAYNRILDLVAAFNAVENNDRRCDSFREYVDQVQQLVQHISHRTEVATPEFQRSLNGLESVLKDALEFVQRPRRARPCELM